MGRFAMKKKGKRIIRRVGKVISCALLSLILTVTSFSFYGDIEKAYADSKTPTKDAITGASSGYKITGEMSDDDWRSSEQKNYEINKESDDKYLLK